MHDNDDDMNDNDNDMIDDQIDIEDRNTSQKILYHDTISQKNNSIHDMNNASLQHHFTSLGSANSQLETIQEMESDLEDKSISNDDSSINSSSEENDDDDDDDDDSGSSLDDEESQSSEDESSSQNSDSNEDIESGYNMSNTNLGMSSISQISMISSGLLNRFSGLTREPQLPKHFDSNSKYRKKKHHQATYNFQYLLRHRYRYVFFLVGLIIICQILLLWNLGSMSETSSEIGMLSELNSKKPISWNSVKFILKNRDFKQTVSTYPKYGAPLSARMTRAVGRKSKRSFGCLREGCRGLEIEELLDRGWSMRFKTCLVNGTREYRDMNYHTTVLMADTTNLNHVASVRSDISNKIMEDYIGSTYLTAFDGGDAIGGNKGQQLRTKMRYAQRFKCKYNNLGLQPPQYRLYIKEECDDLTAKGESDPGMTWLAKPEAGSQGQGITFHKQVYEIESKHPSFFPCKEDKELPATQRVLVQQYIQNPLLLHKCKFDVRVYMLVASSEPWLVFYHEGYLRRALTPYSATSTDRKVYLTNTHFQSMKSGFKLSDHVWPFQTFQEYLTDNGVTGAHYVESILNPFIKSVATYVFKSAEHKLKPRHGSFQIFGLDFMIDDQFGVHFIEANGYPGFTWSINFDSRSMVENLYDLVLELNENPAAFNLMRPGDRFGSWELISSDIYDTRSKFFYNPCEEFADNIPLSRSLKASNNVLAKISGKRPGASMTAYYNETTYVPRIPGWRYIGGDRGDTFKVRSQFAENFTCTYHSLQIEPETVVLYNETDCEKAMHGVPENKGAWVVKSESGRGNGDRLYFFESFDDAKQDPSLFPCGSHNGDYIIQKFIPKRFRLDVNGLRQSEQIKVTISPDDDLKERRQQAAESTKLELINPPNTLYFESQQNTRFQVHYDIRAYMLVASVEPFFVMYHDGFLRSSRHAEFDDGYLGFVLNEHVLSFDSFQYYLAKQQLTGPHFVSSVLRPYLRNVMEYVAHSSRSIVQKLSQARQNQSSHFHQLFSFNFVLDEDLRAHLVGIDGDAEKEGFFPVSSIGNVSIEVRDVLNDLERHRRELVLELSQAPAAFARMRYGDSYGGFSVVYSEFENLRQSQLRYDPCMTFAKPTPNLETLKRTAKIQDFAEKQKASHLREMDKYVKKRWQSCRMRSSREAQASCIRGEIAYRYMIFIQKERIPYDPTFVSTKIAELQGARSDIKLPQWKIAAARAKAGNN